MLVGLFQSSCLRTILADAVGPHTPPQTSFVAVVEPGQQYGADIDKDKPPAQIQAHVDGGWAGLCPMRRSEIEAAGQTLETWGSDGDPNATGPSGMAPLWQDAGRTVGIGSYTAFCGICLNDQTHPGKGQFAVHRGAHEAVEAFFRMQQAAGGPLGGGGPLWPRLVPAGKDSAVGGTMPAAMIATYPSTTDAAYRFEHPDWPWPELTPVLLAPGDGLISLHATPHTATP